MLTTKLQTIITTGSIAAMIALSPMAAFAQTTPGARAQARTANQTTRLATLHTTADTAISKRLTDLNTAQTRINGLVKLSSDKKSQYSGEISGDISALTALKGKVDGDTDAETLRTDYRTIFTTYRVYAEFLPQLHLLTASDTMDVTADKLSDLATKLQTRIQSAGSPANLTSLLSDMQAKVADAKTQYSNAQTQVTSLTPQSYDSNPTGTKTTLATARGEIKTGAGDVKTALSDAKQITQALKTSTINPTPTP